MASTEYVYITAGHYKRMRCTSWTGGVAWFKSPDFPAGHILISCTPVEINKHFAAYPEDRVRVTYRKE